MQLINTDGMSFIGPGSEWFWTALTGVVLALTFIAIYRQLRLQRSQGAIEQIAAFTREWNSERLLMHRRTVLIALRDGDDPAVLLPVVAAGLALADAHKPGSNAAALLRRAPEQPDIKADEQQARTETEKERRPETAAYLDRFGAYFDRVIYQKRL